MATSGNLRSIVAMLLAVGFFSLMDTLMKLLVAHYPALQVAALRGLSALPLVLGNLLVIVLEAMVVSIQTTRLVLFEFFTRFMQGQGRAFRPLPAPPFTTQEN